MQICFEGFVPVNYLSFRYVILVVFALLLYYLLPLRFRWLALLGGSIVFYVLACPSFMALLLFFSSILIAYTFGRILETRTNHGNSSRLLLASAIILICIPLFLFKISRGSYAGVSFLSSWVFPLGLSFYTLQLISYLVDVSQRKIDAERNFLHFVLFSSFFPQIVQGPIPRYGHLGRQLTVGHPFNFDEIIRGLQLILWGLFIKLMIADKLMVPEECIYNNTRTYQGVYLVVAAVLYLLRLYTDFLSCVTISQGVAALFGIRLDENFLHPFFSRSVKDYWRRWHVSLSNWLRDYIYIPLGGSRKGKLRKYMNLLITFAVSGFWHGANLTYLLWGILNAVYQILEDCTCTLREKLFFRLGMPSGSLPRNILQTLFTFCLVAASFIAFRAETIRQAVDIYRSIFTVCNPWVLVDGSLLQLGLDGRDWNVLILSLAVFAMVSFLQQKICIRDWINRQHICIRWSIYLLAVLSIIIYGSYGVGYQAQDFIYGAF